MNTNESSTTNAVTISGEKPKLNVFNVHCDPYAIPSSADSSLTYSKNDNKWGLFEKDTFIILRGYDLLNSIVSQLEKHMSEFESRGETYKADSVYIQLGDSQGEMGSEMVSSNLATRLVNQLQAYRDFAAKGFSTHYPGSKMDKKSIKFTPTAAGLRIYLKLPTGTSVDETKEKIAALLEKYRGAAADQEGDKVKALTFKINMFGCYNDKFYMNYRIISPFDIRNKDEVLAAPVTAKKPAVKRKASTDAGSDTTTNATTNASLAKKTKTANHMTASDNAGSKAIKLKKQKPVNPEDFETEEELCMAYIAGGINAEMAASLAKAQFELRELEKDDTADDILGEDEE